MKKVQIISLAIFLMGCWSGQEPLTFEKRVKTAVVEPLNFYEKEFVGSVFSAQNVNLAFGVSGLIIAMYVSEGEYVAKNQLLAQLSADDYQLQVDAAKSKYISEQSITQRAERLFGRGAISTQELEITKANYSAAKSNYDFALQNLYDTKLYAPFSGAIEKQFVDTFQEVVAGTQIFRLSAPSNLEVKFTLPEADVNMLLTKVDYYLEFENLPSKRISAYVKSVIEGSSDRAGLPITLGFDDKGLTKLVKPGFSVRVIMKFVDSNDFDSYTLVPLSALYSETELWVYNPDTEEVESRIIKTEGLKGNDKVIISKGLKSGEIVVVAGVHALSAGQKVVRINN